MTDTSKILEELQPKKIQALCLLAAGKSNIETSKITEIPTSTLERWKSEPNFKAALRQAVADFYDQAMAEFALGAVDAAIELKRIINDADIPARTKITAIGTLFSYLEKTKSYVLELRLENIEDKLNHVEIIDVESN